MKAAVLYTLGKPPRYEQFPEPSAGEGEVIVHVRAAALKPVDKQMAEGSHYASPRKLPAVVGVDGVGRLEDDTRVVLRRTTTAVRRDGTAHGRISASVFSAS